MTLSRNAPCPCGSGIKYKHCCLGKAPEEQRSPMQKMFLWGILLAILVVAAGSGWYWGWAVGARVGVMGVVIVGGYFVFRKPPASTGRSGGANIDFGK